MKFSTILFTALTLKAASAFSGPFLPPSKANAFGVPKTQSSLQMVDCESQLLLLWMMQPARVFTYCYRSHLLFLHTANVIQGAGIAIAGLAAGIGMVAFTEAQGERAKERGGGLSDNMSTQLSGMLLEDVEVSSVSDVGSLTSQLERALKASGGTSDEELEITEEDRKRLTEEADDGW